jgi:putative chitinase
MQEAEIITPKRQAMFLAQLGHESGGLQWMEEFASGKAYEGRRDLGNTQPGDGVRFKGRGPIQLTGRENYTRAGRDLGLDLVNNPKQVATPEVGFRTAAWFWTDKGINGAADQMNLKEATRLINPGLLGLDDRAAYYARARRALGV